MLQSNSYPELIDRTRRDLIFLSRSGIRVQPSCRFNRYLRQLEAAARADGFSVPKGINLPIWVRSLVELDDLHLVISELARFPEVVGWQSGVEEMLAGHAMRGEEVKHSSGRDKQFELVTAAMFRQAGYAIELEEPDVFITSTVPRFGIAAKRPRSLSALRRNVEDAGRQIRRSGHLGLIALDITCANAPDDPSLVVDDFVAAYRSVISTADRFIHRQSAVLAEARKTDLAIGWGVHFAMPIFVSLQHRPRFAYARRYVFSNWLSLDDPRTKLVSNAINDMLLAERAA